MNQLTIFLSHSHKDIDKVRKIREILESLEFEPLMFYLKCLDDNNSELEDFIKREIDARNIFVYCKSENAEKSDWVQKELAYIKQSDIRRLYEIDIDLPLNKTLVTLLQDLCNIIRKNSVFVSFSRSDMEIYNTIEKMLTDRGYNVISFITCAERETEKHEKQLREIIKNGIFKP